MTDRKGNMWTQSKSRHLADNDQGGNNAHQLCQKGAGETALRVKGGIAFRENGTASSSVHLKSEFLACLFAGFPSNHQSECYDCGI